MKNWENSAGLTLKLTSPAKKPKSTGDGAGAHVAAGASAAVAEHHFDPRFLVGEYMFEILLRKRQVEIVTEMAQSATQHSSKVQQMIMVRLTVAFVISPVFVSLSFWVCLPPDPSSQQQQ